MAKISFVDNLTGLEDKKLKWDWVAGPKVGMVISDGERSYVVTDVIFKNNGRIIIYISVKMDSIGIPMQKLLEVRREELLKK